MQVIVHTQETSPNSIYVHQQYCYKIKRIYEQINEYIIIIQCCTITI